VKQGTQVKPFYIGTYRLACLNVELYGDPTESGGHVRFLPDKKNPPRIIIGLYPEIWHEVVCVFLHESFEFCAALQDHTYIPPSRSIQDTGDYLFSFDHKEFSRLCEYQAPFVAAALPDLASAYNKLKHRKA
jgi:hypothetical protein